MNGILSPKGQRIYDSLMGEAEDTYRFGSLSKTQQDNIIVPKIKNLYNSQQLNQNDARIIADRFGVAIDGINIHIPTVGVPKIPSTAHSAVTVEMKQPSPKPYVPQHYPPIPSTESSAVKVELKPQASDEEREFTPEEDYLFQSGMNEVFDFKPEPATMKSTGDDFLDGLYGIDEDDLPQVYTSPHAEAVTPKQAKIIEQIDFITAYDPLYPIVFSIEGYIADIDERIKQYDLAENEYGIYPNGMSKEERDGLRLKKAAAEEALNNLPIILSEETLNNNIYAAEYKDLLSIRRPNDVQLREIKDAMKTLKIMASHFPEYDGNYKKIVKVYKALEAKTKSAAYGTGMKGGLTFGLHEKMEATGQQKEPWEYDQLDKLANADTVKRANPGWYKAGQVTGDVIQMFALYEVGKAIQGAKPFQGINNTFLRNVVSAQAADTVISTPLTLVNSISEGKSAGQIAEDVIVDQLTNLGGNTLISGVDAYFTKQLYGNTPGEPTFKFSEMPQEKIDKFAKKYRKRSPIEIPKDAKYKAQSMNKGYEQLSFKWKESKYDYEVRWHTHHPNAPEGQGNVWVVQRKWPSPTGVGKKNEFFVYGEWVSGEEWFGAIRARDNGVATKEQLQLLQKGHWKG